MKNLAVHAVFIILVSMSIKINSMETTPKALIMEVKYTHRDLITAHQIHEASRVKNRLLKLMGIFTRCARGDLQNEIGQNSSIKPFYSDNYHYFPQCTHHNSVSSPLISAKTRSCKKLKLE